MDRRIGRAVRAAGAILGLVGAGWSGEFLLATGGSGAPPPRPGPGAMSPEPRPVPAPPPLAAAPPATPDPPSGSAEIPFEIVAEVPPAPPDPRPLPLEIRVVDGTTGGTVGGASVSRESPGGDCAELPLRTEGDRHLDDESPFRAGGRGSVRIRVRLPEGFAALGKGEFLLSGTVGRFAERVVATVVVWPEARVRLRVEEEDGTPVPGAEAYGLTLGGVVLAAGSGRTGPDGEAALRGVPLLPGERLTARCSAPGRDAAARRLVLSDRGEDPILRVVLPREENRHLEWENAFGGGVGGFSCGRIGNRHRHLAAGHRGALRVRVFRTDGRPASEVRVVAGGFSAITGPDGTARFPSLVAGRREVSVREPGFLVHPAAVTVPPGGEATVDLHQSPGESLEVLVLAAEGNPAAGAGLVVDLPDGSAYCPMEGPAQQFGLPTAPDGRRLLRGLAPGPVTVTATLGSRTARATAEGTAYLEIRLPRVP